MESLPVRSSAQTHDRACGPGSSAPRSSAWAAIEHIHVHPRSPCCPRSSHSQLRRGILERLCAIECTPHDRAQTLRLSAPSLSRQHTFSYKQDQLCQFLELHFYGRLLEAEATVWHCLASINIKLYLLSLINALFQFNFVSLQHGRLDLQLRLKMKPHL